ncbi:copper amine oxidase N-terminal domain-containing protein [Bacillus sp. Marseille-P3661]|uniref:copper amine oxidase N-terminal domain-containing protein n=1 Tax=Bacillus sp. Marseille-P3661 TaxID=1936234 RepID=UPI000C836FFA|nr:copper amine oxidase N-terminal domain-containing protein [Bacillus sp. Marseille-P3661]
MSYLPRYYRNIINIGIAFVMILLSLLSPIVTEASTSSITSLTNPILYDDPGQTLGRIKIVVPAGSIKTNDVMVVKLPYNLNGGISTEIYNEDSGTIPTGTNYVFVPKNNNGLQNNNFTITSIAGDEFKLTATADASYSTDTVIYLFFNSVDIDKGDEGAIVVNFSSPDSSGFPRGSVVAGTVVNKGLVIVSAEEVVKSNNFFTFKLRLKEDIYQSLESGNSSLKLKLPKGYKWAMPTQGSETTIYGENVIFNYNVTENELILNVESDQTTIPSMWEIPLRYTVVEDSFIAPGDVMAQLNGTSNVDHREIKVGEYAEYGVAILINDDVPNLHSGKTDQRIAPIEFLERVPGSFIVSRTLYLTVPAGVKWVDYDTDRDGINLGIPSLTNDGRSLKYNLSGSNADVAKLKLDNLKVAIQPGFNGPLKIEVEGAGIEKQDIVVANVNAPVDLTTSSVPNVDIGVSNQKAANIIIKENAKEALNKGGTLEFVLPNGVDFVDVPTVNVTNGNLFIDDVRLRNNTFSFVIDEESTVASTITLSNINLRIDRSVPEGNIDVLVKGSALIETVGSYVLNQNTYDLWNNNDTYHELGIANVITPAPSTGGSSKREKAEFTLGSTTYKIGNQVKTMDIMPFVEKDRTYLPVRFAADSIGVDMDFVIWDNDSRTVTILRDNRVVQLTIGSKVLKLNGINVMMDVPAKIRNDRTILPIRFVAQAIGAQVSFDESARKVTIS